MAVIISNADGGSEHMEVCRPNTQFKDVTGAIEDVITTGDDGWGIFPVEGKSVSVWVQV